jgi:hypothetical protein
MLRSDLYVAQYLRDANVEYPNTNGSKISQEAFVRDFQHADYWLNSGSFSSGPALTTMDDLLTAGVVRETLIKFSFVECNEVYAEDNRATPGNPIYELAVLRPDLLLDDYVQIFHPGVAEPGRKLVFYHRVAETKNKTGIGACSRAYFTAVPPSLVVYVSAPFRVTGVTTHRFLASIPNGFKANTTTELGARPEDVEVVISGSPPPMSVTEFFTRITVRHTQCLAASKDCGIASLGRKLEAIEDKLVQWLQPIATGVVRVERSATVTVASSNQTLPLDAYILETESSYLSAGPIAGIVVGCVIFVILLTVLVGYVVSKLSYEKGEQHAYATLGQETPRGSEIALKSVEGQSHDSARDV